MLALLHLLFQRLHLRLPLLDSLLQGCDGLLGLGQGILGCLQFESEFGGDLLLLHQFGLLLLEHVHLLQQFVLVVQLLHFVAKVPSQLLQLQLVLLVNL